MNLGNNLPQLQSLGILKGLSNPTDIPRSDIIGLLIGGSVGWVVAKKFPNTVVKVVGVVVGAELGILIARMLASKTTIVGGK